MKIHINYVTTSAQKSEENEILRRLPLPDGTPISDLFSFSLWREQVVETLEVDLVQLVAGEVSKAYERLKIPCVVEHAGLILEDHLTSGYPGGLTKAMWNALGGDFVKELGGGGRSVVARAVVAYCDGVAIRTFSGETVGRLADAPRGTRDFYWDRVFVPSELPGVVASSSAGLTYSEIVERHGLEFKVANLSQSTKAMLRLLEQLRKEKASFLWG